MHRLNLTLLLFVAVIPACSDSTANSNPANSAALKTNLSAPVTDSAKSNGAESNSTEKSTDSAQAEDPSFDGTWQVETAEMGGKPMGDDFVKSTTLTIDGENYTVMVSGGADKGTTKVDKTTSPKSMDIMGTDGPNKGKTFLAIYEWNDGKLKVCYDLSGAERPKEFATKPSTYQFLATYRRK
jgi:uncharacterized protein (TIGR03067 family)